MKPRDICIIASTINDAHLYIRENHMDKDSIIIVTEINALRSIRVTNLEIVSISPQMESQLHNMGITDIREFMIKHKMLVMQDIAHYYTPESVEELLTYLVNEERIWAREHENPDHIVELNLSEHKVTDLDAFIQFNNMSESPQGKEEFTIDNSLYLIKSLEEDDFSTLKLKIVEGKMYSHMLYTEDMKFIGDIFIEDYVTRIRTMGLLFTVKNIYELKQLFKILGYADIKKDN